MLDFIHQSSRWHAGRARTFRKAALELIEEGWTINPHVLRDLRNGILNRLDADRLDEAELYAREIDRIHYEYFYRHNRMKPHHVKVAFENCPARPMLDAELRGWTENLSHAWMVDRINVFGRHCKANGLAA